ncbi:MAG: hypothetical protein JKX85_02395 [Phycisphaeraceae bacterium]|nr:hypothetical protein [Phycisphaeraceae bacterium]
MPKQMLRALMNPIFQQSSRTSTKHTCNTGNKQATNPSTGLLRDVQQSGTCFPHDFDLPYYRLSISNDWAICFLPR